MPERENMERLREVRRRYMTDAEFHARVEATRQQLEREDRRGFLPDLIAVMLNAQDKSGILSQHPDPVREALAFYADSVNYAPQNPPGTGSPIWRDAGQRARNALADPPLGRVEPEVPTQIRAEQIEQGDRLWIEDEGEWYAATRVVVREADVLLWLDDEDEPWDTLRRDQIMWRLSRVEQVGGDERELYLGRPNGLGAECVDGAHDTEAEVAKAAKLNARIFGDSGPWVMVEIHSLPDIDPPINEDAADACRSMLPAKPSLEDGGRHPLGIQHGVIREREDAEKALARVEQVGGDEREAVAAFEAIMQAEGGAGYLSGPKGIAEVAVDQAVAFLYKRGRLTDEQVAELERRGSIGETVRLALAARPAKPSEDEQQRRSQ